MAKKIYDVMPPQEAHKVERTIKALAQSKIKPKVTVKRPRQPAIKKELSQVILPQSQTSLPATVRRFPAREIFVGVIIILVLFGIYFYNKLPKADIEISPSLEDVTMQAKVIADKSVTEVNLQKNIIPLQLLEEVKESSQEFPATGISSNDGKATGMITIYNKISPIKPLTLVAGTHFLSDSGKYFITLSKVTVPAMQGKTQGSITVQIQAQDVGSEYNIGSSKFSVPGLSGTAYYYGIDAESKAAMTGGYAGKVKKVTTSDLESAEDVLTKRLLEDAKNSLANSISDDKIVFKDAVMSKVIRVTSDAKAEAIKDNFTTTEKVKVSFLVIAKKDLEALVKDGMTSHLEDGRNLLEHSLHLNYQADSVDFTKGMERISLTATAKTYSDIDLSGFLDLIKKKSFAEIQEVTHLKYGDTVAGVKVNFWPFWVTKAPKDIRRIRVNLSFE